MARIRTRDLLNIKRNHLANTLKARQKGPLTLVTVRTAANVSKLDVTLKWANMNEGLPLICFQQGR